MSETWEEAVFRIVKDYEGDISLQEIYEGMATHPLVMPHLVELWGGQPNYHHSIRSYLARLKRKGLVRHVGRALYNSK